MEYMEKADKQNILTAFGKDVLKRLNVACADAYNRGGDLTPLGAKEHIGIAQRTFNRYPEIFSKPINIDARSSYVIRCALSMSNFCNELKALNPKLNIEMTSSKRDMWYICNDQDDSIKHVLSDTIVYKKFRTFLKEQTHTERFCKALFNDDNFIKSNIKGGELMKALYNICRDMQCLPELHLSFDNLFTKEEMFDMWQKDNADWAYWDGFFKLSRPRYASHSTLLRHILNGANKAITTGKPTATLIFGHDSGVSALSFMLRLHGCYDLDDQFDTLYKQWATFDIIPMGANIQLVFYHKTNNKDILVKFLRNEKETSIPIKTDCFPYYHWKDVKAFYQNILNECNSYKIK
jgi:hypothetical protein